MAQAERALEESRHKFQLDQICTPVLYSPETQVGWTETPDIHHLCTQHYLQRTGTGATQDQAQAALRPAGPKAVLCGACSCGRGVRRHPEAASSYF